MKGNAGLKQQRRREMPPEEGNKSASVSLSEDRGASGGRNSVRL